MSAADSPRLRWSWLGNGAALALLVGGALWLLQLHERPWFAPAPQRAHWLGATLTVLAYAGFALWTSRRPRTIAAAIDDPANGDGTLLVAYASQTGFALQLAERTTRSLREGGCAVALCDLAEVRPQMLARARACLFIASTTGEGDPPDHALAFVRDAMSAPPPAGLRYAVLALGDRSYANFCAFGHQLDTWLRHGGAQPLFDLVEVDNGDAGALRHWQHHLSVLAGAPELPEWAPARYERWRLAERKLLNPGSPGGAVYHLVLEPPAGREASWSAGDIVEIGPRQGEDAVDRLLDALALDGRQPVRTGDDLLPLGELLARSHLPDPAQALGLDAQSLAATLTALPHREYSIASIPADGAVHLLLRRVLRPDGTPGLGSAWLCDYAEVGGTIDLRLRPNPSFHPPRDGRPMLLIGNGTGIAGLRALLKARIADGHRRNWLIFGERTRAHDVHYGEELQAWQAAGAIERLDLVFSRDGGPHRYVQHAMREHAQALRDWLRQGAAVYVCGSLRGMAPAVDAELATLVGRDELERMAADGRYRRDVY
jgi:sulfite reductase (NADPH) flavoprotein alpha-component